MTPSWPIYEAEHSINILCQLLLCHIPVCEEYLVEDKVMLECHLEIFLTSLELIESPITLRCGRYFVLQRTIRFTPEASKLDGSNYQDRDICRWEFANMNKLSDLPNNINDKEGIPLRWRHQTLDTF